MLSIKKLFKNKLNQTMAEEYTPCKKLWDDIQRDYYFCDEMGNYRPTGQKGFLNKELFLKGNKYYVIPRYFDSGTLKLIVEDESENDVFSVVILYGSRFSNPNQYILYIEDFSRLTDSRCGIGTEMLEYIKRMAKDRGFNIIGVHAVAAPNACKGAMNQEQLEAFYEEKLNDKSIRLEYMNNSDDVNRL